MGSALHCAVLEHSTFNDRYIVEPDVDKRTKAGKEEYAVFLHAMEKKGSPIILTQNQLETVNKMVKLMKWGKIYINKTSLHDQPMKQAKMHGLL